MRKEMTERRLFDLQMGCFGNYEPEDPICRKFCALNLRCTIEQEQNVRMEILEDLVSSDNAIVTIQ